jgi:hypothetical protein
MTTFLTVSGAVIITSSEFYNYFILIRENVKGNYAVLFLQRS